jgi:ATP-binding cassette subfamily F protein 3
MDEPTNHLDLEAIEWLQNYLNDYKGTLLVISHDRYFLDHVCTTMGEMLGGRVTKFTGNYSEYQKKRAADFEARAKAYQLQQKEIEREQVIIARYRSFNREKSIRAAESRQKRLDKLERLEKPEEESHVRFSFDVRPPHGRGGAGGQNLQKSFEGRAGLPRRGLQAPLRRPRRAHRPQRRGQEHAVQDSHGRMAPDAGSVRYGTNVDVGYYDQHQQDLNPEEHRTQRGVGTPFRPWNRRGCAGAGAVPVFRRRRVRKDRLALRWGTGARGADQADA